MSDSLLVFSMLLVGALIGGAVGIELGKDDVRKQAVAHAYGSYSPQDGKFFWITKEPTP